MRFYLRHRDALFPGRPLLVTGIDNRMLKGVVLGAADRVVSADLDLPGVARSILALQPDVTTIALVLGCLAARAVLGEGESSASSRRWTLACACCRPTA